MAVTESVYDRKGYCSNCQQVRTIVKAGNSPMCLTCRSGRIVALEQLPLDHPHRPDDA